MADGPNPAAVMRLTEADNGTTVCAAAGAELVLRLPAQPGTGFCWDVVRRDDDRLELVGDPSFEGPPGGGVGSTQAQVFRFRVRAAGAGVLELAYRRVFERNVRPARTFVVEISNLD